MREAVIVALGRSAIGKSPKGKLKGARPEDIGAQVLKGVLDKIELDPKDIDDVIVGCAFPEAEQGMNLAKVITQRAGLGDVCGQTVNRFCSSGLQSIGSAAAAIVMGQGNVIVAGGVELMSSIPIGGNMIYPNPGLMEEDSEAYVSMGITAENVAEQYNITREEQDLFAVKSHKKAYAAQQAGKFKEEIIPVETKIQKNDSKGMPEIVTEVFDVDEGIRANSSMESLGRLRPPFKMGGTVTAGNASQTSDGAAFVVLMEKEEAIRRNLKPIAKVVMYAVAPVPPEIMGMGPAKAIPKALDLADLTLDDIDLYELNEAFASQAIACMNELGLNPDTVNVNGGAIALGHPLGCTGAFLTVKLLSELKRRNAKRGIVSMCIGGGMGAAGIFEML